MVPQAVALLQVGEGPWAIAAHTLGIACHHLQRRAHIGGKVGFIDHQEIGFGDPRSAFARDLLPSATSMT